MRFMTDENLHDEVAGMLCEAGHDAISVFAQRMRGVADEDLAVVCRRESRALVTLDLDFADVRAYPPPDYPGLVVIRVDRPDRLRVMRSLKQILPLLHHEPLEGRLWIVDRLGTRLRIRGE